MLDLFTANLLPILLSAGAGYLLAAILKLDPRPLSRVAFYVFAPCLVFRIIVESDVTGNAVARMVGFTLASLLGLALVAWLIARRVGWSRTVVSAIVVVVLLPNAGNFGLSVNLFAFGKAGLAQASLFFVTSAILTFTVGVFVASLGRASLGTALAALPKVPTIWAVAIALITKQTGWSLPFPLERTVEVLSPASIPVFLVVLGMQLHGKGFKGPLGPTLFAAGFRLVAGGLAGLALAPLFGLEGAARQAGIIQSAMPSAVICIVLATEYDVEPAFVTSVVLLTTLLSPLTITPLLAFLGA